MPYIPKDQIAAAREMDLLTYLRRFEPEELVHIGGDNLCHPHPRQPENLQWKMVLVVAEYRRHKCAGLSDPRGGAFLSGCRSAHPRRIAPYAAQIRANRTAPEN